MKKIETIDQLQTAIKALGFGESKKDSTNRLIVYTTEKDRVSELKTLAKRFDGHYSPAKSGPGWKSSQGSTRIGNFTVLIKPAAKEGASASISSLDARVFAKLGREGKFHYAGHDVPVMTFKSAQEIEKSVLHGIKTTPTLGEGIYDQFKDFFDDYSFSWTQEIPDPVIRKLGVYAGEILVGWAYFINNRQQFLHNMPFNQKPHAFHLPTDPAFSGIDSFIEKDPEDYVAISTKFGRGAAASFFSNLLEKGVKQKDKLRKSTFKQICDYVHQRGIQVTRSKDIVYGYGIEKMLHIRSSNPTQIFADITHNKKSKEVGEVTAAIKKHKQATPEIKEKLPKSVSAFFNRSIAENLNNDESSDQIKHILAGKDYWQSNIDINEWKKGHLKIDFLRSGKAELQLIGSKSAIDDITCKQGWINYILS